MTTFTASLRSDRHVKPAVRMYRFLTAEECRNLTGRVQVIDPNGRIAEVKITSVKTWKTRPDIRIGWKYGLYEFGTEFITSDRDNRFFVTEVEETEAAEAAEAE